MTEERQITVNIQKQFLKFLEIPCIVMLESQYVKNKREGNNLLELTRTFCPDYCTDFLLILSWFVIKRITIKKSSTNAWYKKRDMRLTMFYERIEDDIKGEIISFNLDRNKVDIKDEGDWYSYTNHLLENPSKGTDLQRHIVALFQIERLIQAEELKSEFPTEAKDETDSSLHLAWLEEEFKRRSEKIEEDLSDIIMILEKDRRKNLRVEEKEFLSSASTFRFVLKHYLSLPPEKKREEEKRIKKMSNKIHDLLSTEGKGLRLSQIHTILCYRLSTLSGDWVYRKSCQEADI